MDAIAAGALDASGWPGAAVTLSAIATTGPDGTVEVSLPSYFETENRDFGYQFTCIGQFAQAIVGDEVKGNRFTIRTDKPNVKVSWQVTGLRNDAYARAHPMEVEQMKRNSDRGLYLYPKEHGFWDFFHEGRLEIAMLCGSVFLLIVGAGTYSFDARMNPDRAPAVVT